VLNGIRRRTEVNDLLPGIVEQKPDYCHRQNEINQETEREPPDSKPRNEVVNKIWNGAKNYDAGYKPEPKSLSFCCLYAK
jgi:hypothetical protein